ncbi:MAG: diguanylate cyclase [Clostridia bacterium]|nr:diguanylate cyclase [Clostridia bacterium]
MDIINNRFKIINVIDDSSIESLFLVVDLFKEEKKMLLRILNPEISQSKVIDYFKKNFITLSTIVHPNLTQVYNFNIIDTIDSNYVSSRQYFYTFEYFHGKGILDAVRGAAYEEKAKYLLQVLKAVYYLHRRGFIHRNLDAKNMIVTSNGNEPQVKILGMMVNEEVEKILFKNLKSSAPFRVPEALNSFEGRFFADLYSLGVLSFYLLTGENPERSNFHTVFRSYIENQKKRKENPDTQKITRMMEVIGRLTTEDKSKRFKDIGEVINTVEGIWGRESKVQEKNYAEKVLTKTEIVGRKESLEQLEKWGNEALINKSRKRFTLVKGETGAGKSRILEEISHENHLNKVRVVHFAFNEAENKGYKSIGQIIKQIIPFTPGDVIKKYGSEIIKILPEVKGFQDIKPTQPLAGDKEKLRLKLCAANFIMDAVQKEQALIILDNAQWMDDFTAEVFEYLFISSKANSIWVIIAFNEEEMDSNRAFSSFVKKWEASGFTNEVVLPGFNYQEAHEFIKKVLGSNSIPESIAANIIRETDGNPGFLKDTITALFVEKKLFVDGEGYWNLTYDGDKDYIKLSLPSNRYDAIWKRIHTLNKEALELLHLMSIFNSPVPLEVISKVSGLKREKVSYMTESLVNLQLIDQKVEEWGYSYEYHLKNIKKEIYGGLDKDFVKGLHSLAAKVLEELFKEENRGNHDELIHHLMRSGELEKALNCMIHSAEKMMNLNIYSQALIFLKKAYQVSQDISSDGHSMRAMALMAKLYQESGENDKAFHCCFKVLDYAWKLDDYHTIIDTKIMMGLLYIRKNDLEKAQELFEEALTMSGEFNYDIGYLEAFRNKCGILTRKCRHQEVIDSNMIIQCIKEYDHEKYYFYHAQLYNTLGVNYMLVGKIEDALRSFETSIKLFEKAGNSIEVARPINNIGVIYFDYLQNSSKAREYNEKALEIQMKFNKIEGIAIDYHNIGETYWMEDNYKRALEYFLKCEELAGEIELNNTLFTAYINILQTYIDLGDYGKAYDYFQKAQQEIEKSPEQGWDLPFFYENAARFFYEIGSFEEAKTYAGLGIEIYNKTGVSEKSYLNCRSLLLLSEDKKEKAIQYNEMDRILDEFRRTDLIKDRHKTVQRFLEIYIQDEKREKAHPLLWESGKLMDSIETNCLKANYLYLEGILDGGIQGIEKINEAMEIIVSDNNLPFKWKACKAIGDLYFKQGEQNEAVIYYLKSMDILYKIALTVPKQFRTLFFNTRQRNIPRKRLLEIKEKLLEEQIINIEKNHFDCTDSERDDMLTCFFNEADFSLFFSDQRAVRRFDEGEDISYNTINKIRGVIGQMPEDFENNLKLVLNTACTITQAEKGFILIYDENENLKVFVSHKQRDVQEYYEYIVEQAKDNKDGIFATDIFGKNFGQDHVMIPPHVKGIICIPICEGIRDEGNLKRRNKEVLHKNIKGFIYLSTESLFNNFVPEAFNACKVLSDLAYLSLENYHLKILSSIDKLTGVYTRKYFESVIEQQLRKAENENAPLSIIMLDIDKFKNINDRFGHQKGDEVLRRIGSVLKRNIRQTDICCRYGGEEFIILSPNASMEQVEIFGERIRSAVEKEQIMDGIVPLTISLGISNFPKHGKWKDELIGKADQALYHAKESGRNICAIWNNKIGKFTKRMDKLAGILSGNDVQDQRNVLVLLEMIQLVKEKTSASQKIFKVLGRVIETLEAEQGILFILDERGGEIKRTFGRKGFVESWVGDVHYNKKIIEKVLLTKTGKYLVDWDNIDIVDSVTGEPKWQSVLVVPIIYHNKIRGILYLTSPINTKEFGFNEFNFVSTLADIIGFVISEKET